MLARQMAKSHPHVAPCGQIRAKHQQESCLCRELGGGRQGGWVRGVLSGQFWVRQRGISHTPPGGFPLLHMAPHAARPGRSRIGRRDVIIGGSGLGVCSLLPAPCLPFSPGSGGHVHTSQGSVLPPPEAQPAGALSRCSHAAAGGVRLPSVLGRRRQGLRGGWRWG